ncbi:hypothetical protein, partial [Enhygromyxa salina]|uniref:hypothetical protein n=1 Tax=Enhygromyxa salina TaxID=215803 RepID=UPI0015E7244B
MRLRDLTVVCVALIGAVSACGDSGATDGASLGGTADTSSSGDGDGDSGDGDGDGDGDTGDGDGDPGDG